MIIVTVNNSVTQFFQLKINPPRLWNACDYVIQFNFNACTCAWQNNTVADYLSRLEISPEEKFTLRIWEEIPTTPIELHVQSAGVSEEEPIFCTEDDDETEKQIIQQKRRLRPTQQITYPIFHSTNLPHTKVITTNFQHYKKYHIRTL